jgi:hypothetical protein
MAKLKLGTIIDDKPVKLTLELSAGVHRELLAYAEILSRESGHPVSDPAKLIAPMLARFMATDRAFVKSRRSFRETEGKQWTPVNIFSIALCWRTTSVILRDVPREPEIVIAFERTASDCFGPAPGTGCAGDQRRAIISRSDCPTCSTIIDVLAARPDLPATGLTRANVSRANHTNDLF